ncbi:MAG: tRNA (adenosine(37)-N6)-threonylcarbamoyltransferase complex ATPase subunit type 1 TsaE [Clostridiales bacterium]|jgi:tRNA threonylcarbamoyladenosine biosynthesis protein TsaE|nr:tRNA (adenosine(37)-N6)-threonylcarbamoyltransferase complex ATPase subunit type 1 TsaE [Clostridiales bacterium]
MIYNSLSENDTTEIGYEFGKNAKPGDIFCLCGNLGSGKTVFAKGFAKGLGVKSLVTSPTFTLINQYEGTLPFYHFDVYRIESAREMDELGFEEFFYGDGVCLIEWADVIKDIIPKGSTWINISYGGEKLTGGCVNPVQNGINSIPVESYSAKRQIEVVAC